MALTFQLLQMTNEQRAKIYEYLLATESLGFHVGCHALTGMACSRCRWPRIYCSNF